MEAGFVGVRSATVTEVELGAELLVFDETTQIFSVLNPAVTQVWRAFDGRTPLSEIASRSATSLGATVESIWSDLVGLVAYLSDNGFVVPAGAAHVVASTGLARHPWRFDPEHPGRAEVLTGRPTLVVGIGGTHVGVTTADPEIGPWLQALLAPLRIESDSREHHIVLDLDRRAGGLMGLHLLYESGLRVVATADPGRLVRAALRCLETFTAPSELVTITGRLLVGAHGAVVVQALHEALDLLPVAGLAKLGWQVVDLARIPLDVATGEVVVDELSLAVDDDVLAAFNARYPAGPAEWSGIDGRFPLRRIVGVGYPGPPVDGPETLGGRVGRVLVLAAGQRGVYARDLARLVWAAPRLSIETVDALDPDAVMARLSALT